MNQNTLLLATNNRGKVREIKSILGDLPVKLKAFWQEKSIHEITVKETGSSFAENAALKARTLGQASKLVTLADDSGLEIDALGGKPGVRSARFAKGGDRKRYEKVLRLLHNVPKEKRSARFVAVVAIFDPESGKTTMFEGKTAGRITKEPRGASGFGYDPVFYSPLLKKTFGQATLGEKNRVSHRALALRKAKPFLLARFKKINER